MRLRILAVFVAIGLLTLGVAGLASALADSNTVPPIQMGDTSRRVTANDLKPPECAGLYLGDIVAGAGIITGTPGNDLILGSTGYDIIDGGGGNDCILGMGGNDLLTGGDGMDVCIAGGGSPTYDGCETAYP